MTFQALQAVTYPDPSTSSPYTDMSDEAERERYLAATGMEDLPYDDDEYAGLAELAGIKQHDGFGRIAADINSHSGS